MPRLTFYDYHGIDTRQGTYNGVVGGRGLGKTFGAKKKAIRAALKKGQQFILLRRYKEELAEAKASFFADIAPLFSDWEFRINGRNALASPALEEIEGETEHERKKREKAREWKTIGFFIALSTSQRMKGTSFPDVYTIIFDEFIIEKGNMHYIASEVDVFNNFYSTVDRWNDRVKVYFLANSVNIMNPYFLEWGIRPDQENEFVVKQGGFVVFHFPDSAKFQSEVYETKFGKFIANTDYAKYAVGNEFADNHDMLIQLKDYTATYMFTIETKNGKFSVWKARERGSVVSAKTTYYVQSKVPRGDQIFLTLLAESMNEDKILVTYRDRPLEALRTAFRTGNVMFDEPSTRNTFIDIFERR